MFISLTFLSQLYSRYNRCCFSGCCWGSFQSRSSQWATSTRRRSVERGLISSRRVNRGCYSNRLRHQPHCMLAVALSLFGEGFNGHATQINGLTSGEKHISCGGMGQITGAIHSVFLIRSHTLSTALLTHDTDGGKTGSTVSPQRPIGFNQSLRVWRGHSHSGGYSRYSSNNNIKTPKPPLL